jgi:hypothetical protein
MPTFKTLEERRAEEAAATAQQQMQQQGTVPGVTPAPASQPSNP